jgi:hypothetical protein
VLAKENLQPYFITGFTDAEGCFYIRISQNNNYSTGWVVELSYKLGLDQKDRALLELIIPYLGVGKIRSQGNGIINLQVSSIKGLAAIMDHFDKFPLISQKLADYLLFKQAFELVSRKEHLTMEGLQKIVNIKASMNLGLSDKLKAAFPDYIPVHRPLVLDQKIKDPYWLAGFVGGDGSFIIHIHKSSSHKIGFAVKLKFQITQHTRDTQLMKSLIEYLDCGWYKVRPNGLAGDFIVASFTDINDKVIPFFKLHSPQGVKALDFTDFCRIADIIKTNGHLTADGLEQIKLIKSSMNSQREKESDQ